MKGTLVDSPWRTVQFFLTDRPSVAEVESNTETTKLRCSCDMWGSRQKCSHVVFVKKRSDANGGAYPITFSVTASPRDKARARRSRNDHREFVMRFGRIEVI